MWPSLNNRQPVFPPELSDAVESSPRRSPRRKANSPDGQVDAVGSLSFSQTIFDGPLNTQNHEPVEGASEAVLDLDAIDTSTGRYMKALKNGYSALMEAVLKDEMNMNDLDLPAVRPRRIHLV